MDEKLQSQLKYLGLNWLLENWGKLLEETKGKEISYHKFLNQVINNEYETKKEKATLEQILTYCNTLHIPYKQILPELFTQTTC